MFDKVSQAYIDAYDAITDQHLGRHVFKITPGIERILLDFAHNKAMGDRVVLQNVFFTPASNDYVMPLPYEKLSRRGVVRGMFRDRYSLQWIPVEIRARFNVRGRVRPEKGRFHFDSV
ncbi:MAG: hypothetical protein AAGU23_02760, partial [Bacillota bacterium]